VQSEEGATYVDGQMLVVYEANVTQKQEDAFVATMNAEVSTTAEFDTGDLAVLTLEEGVSVEEVCEQAQADKRVKYALPNIVLDSYANTEEATTVRAESSSGLVRPLFDVNSYLTSDPHASYQWHLKTINAPQAWALLEEYPLSLATTKTMVLDTGASLTHDDLKNIIDPALSGELVWYLLDEATDEWDVDLLPLRGDGYNNGSEEPEYSTGHGTHVTGIIAAEAGNGGMLGVASGGNTKVKNQLLDIGVIDCFSLATTSGPSATLDDILVAMSKAKEKGVRLVNMSLGFKATAVKPEYITMTQEIVTEVAEAGVIMVAAAGNAGDAVKNYPAACPEVISVINTNSNNERHYSSTYGLWCDIAAPGTDIWSTSQAGSDYYETMTGTSMAAPVVTGVIALMLAVNPDLTADEVRAILTETATDLGDPGKDAQFAYGLVNAEAAVQKTMSDKGLVVLSFNANGAISGAVPSPLSSQGAGSFTLPGTTLTKTHYSFTGWNTQADGKGEHYDVGAVLDLTESTVLYAEWLEDERFTLTYDGNGKTAGQIPSNQTGYLNDSFTVGYQEPVRSGHEFICWNTQKNGKGTSYLAGQKITLTGNVTLYAQWEENTKYTLTYNGNGADAASVPASTTQYEYMYFTVTSAVPTKTGYTFKEWNTTAAGTGTAYQAKSSILASKNITLYAQWTKNDVVTVVPDKETSSPNLPLVGEGADGNELGSGNNNSTSDTTTPGTGNVENTTPGSDGGENSTPGSGDDENTNPGTGNNENTGTTTPGTGGGENSNPGTGNGENTETPNPGTGNGDSTVTPTPSPEPTPEPTPEVPAYVVISAPKASNKTYTGKLQTGVATGVGYTVVNGTATKAGTYTAYVTPQKGYAWNTAGDQSVKTITWTISKVAISNSAVKVNNLLKSYVFTAKNITPNITLTFNGVTLKKGTDYKIAYTNNYYAGTATATITGLGSFSGTRKCTYTITAKTPTVTYQAYVQKKGWLKEVSNGARGGTAGQKLRVEGFKIRLVNQPYTGSIQIKAHVQKYGWMNWTNSGKIAGKIGKSLRLEAIQIRLTGNMAKYYDVYYKVHMQKFGDSGWAKNGQSCGSAGYKYRIEAIYVKLVPKGSKAPGSTKNTYYKK
jgi:uncharacterized repeat protein (TIGR02543 family)